MMATEEAAGPPRVSGLNIFPIKSCHALKVEEIRVDSYGVVDDRRFMLVDGNKRSLAEKVPQAGDSALPVH